MAGLDESSRQASGITKNVSAYQPSTLSANQDDAGESSGPRGNEAGSFDCNICLELAQDPIVTLCGHLFCWPCIYRWLHSSLSNKDCPVCKASVEEEKVIPLYGRGKVGSVDPRTKAIPEVDIPHRPAGQRPETARPPEQQYQPFGFGFMGRPVVPAATARFGNLTLSAGFGLFPSLFGFHVQGYAGNAGLGSTHAFPFVAPAGLHGNPFQQGSPHTRERQQEAVLSRLLLFLGCFVIFCLIFF